MSRARELAGFATATNPIQDLNVGVVTAISYSGDGSALTGIDATSIKDGDGTVRAQANTSGVVVTGIITATSLEGDGSALTGYLLDLELLLQQLVMVLMFIIQIKF